MRLITFLFTAIIFLATASCTKNYPQDSQLRFSLPSLATSDTNYLISDSVGNVNSFNADYFTNVDSIVFSFSAFIDLGDSTTYELYDYTDKTPIAGSTITVQGQGLEVGIPIHVSNLNGAFPHKEISLGVRMQNHVFGSFSNIYFPYLYLYRK